MKWQRLHVQAVLFSIGFSATYAIELELVGTWPGHLREFNIEGVAYAVAVEGNHAYLADDNAGLQVIDITNPANPVRVGNYLPPGGISARDVKISGGYAFTAIASPSGLRVVDVRNPAAPVEVGSHNAPGQTDGIAVSGQYAFLGTCDVPVWGGLILGEGVVVIDVSTPSLPMRVSNYDMRAVGHAVATSGQYVYSAHGNFTIIDISNPLAPTLAGNLNLEACCDVALSGNYAYVLVRGEGLHVVDVSNPTAPTGVGSYDTPGFATGVAVSGKYALVADGDLQVIDVSDPATPKHAGSYATSGSAWGVTVSGNHIYVADQRGGLAIFRFTINRPRMQVERGANSIVLSWPIAEEGYVLEAAIAVTREALWSEVPGVEAVGDRFTATVNTSAVRGFYRLRKQQ